MVLDPDGIVKSYHISAEELAKANARGESVDEVGEDYSDHQYFIDAWANPGEFVYTDATASASGVITQDSEDVTISHSIMDEYSGEYSASLHYSLDLDVVFDMVAYRTNGIFDQEEYDERGLGESGDQYLVQTSTKYLYSLSRFQKTEREGVLSLKIDTVGVQNAISNGLHYGIYDDYRGVPIVGYTWNFASQVSGTDHRVPEDVVKRCSFNLPWIYVLEVDEDEIFEPIHDIEAQNNSVIMVIVLVLIAATVIIFAIGTIISGNLASGVVSLSNNMEKGASGDLSQSKEEKIILEKIEKKGDEIGSLCVSYTELLNNIRVVVNGTQESVGILTTTSEDLLSGSEEINASAEEVASTSQAMSNGATSQTELIAEINMDIRDMSNLVGEIVKKIQRNTEEVSQIALQTNILALNAGIEASRAGDYGRGFAVVAENVRKLSDQSKVAAEQIALVADEIAEKLQKSFDKIGSSMVNVVSVSEETAASAEEVAAAAEEMTATIEQLSSAAQELTVQSENSQKMIGKFKL